MHMHVSPCHVHVYKPLMRHDPPSCPSWAPLPMSWLSSVTSYGLPPPYLPFALVVPPHPKRNLKNISLFSFVFVWITYFLRRSFDMFYFLRLFDCFDKNNGERWDNGCAMAPPPPPPLHPPLYCNSRISTKLNTLRDTIESWNTNIMHKVGLETYMYKWGV